MAATILCADDDRSFCQILTKALRAEGYRVEAVHDGEQALARARALAPSLVTLDVMLPRRDGFGVLEALRAEEGPLGATPVVLFSGCRFTPAYTARAEALRADAVLHKPVPLEQILTTVRELAALHARRGRGPAPPAGPGRSARPARRAPAAKRREAGRAPAPDGRRGSRRTRPAAAAARAAARGGAVRSAPPRRPGGAAAPPEAASAETGSLDRLPFPMLLHQLHGLRASGVLQLRSGRKKKQVQLREGRPVAVRSNLVNETLGQLLLASGTITEDVLHASLLRVKRGEGLHGQILQAMHMLDEADLARALRHQAEEKLFEIFAWADGSYRFVRGARLKDANALTLKGSAASLILAGVRGRTPLAVVDRFLGAWGGRFPVLSESPFYRFQEVELDAPARRWLERLDGTTTLAELLGADEATRRLAFGLAVLELVALHEAPKQPPAGSAAAARPLPPRRAAAVAGAAPPPAAAEADAPDPEEALRSELAAMAERLRGRDAFGVLGVARSAGDDAIRSAYTDLAKRTHPDRFSASSEAVRRVAEEVFGIISHAYERIASAQGRAAYVAEERRAEQDRAEIEEAQRALRAEQAYQRGLQELRGRQYARALECFEEAVETYGEEAEYHALRAWAWYLVDPERTGRVSDALRMARKARKLAPDREKPYLVLGRLYKAAGRMEPAEKSFTRAVQLEPDCVEALRELRLIHMRRQKARGLVRRILRR